VRLLRTHVRERSGSRAVVSLTLFGRPPSQAEVDDANAAVAIEHQVRRLNDVTMDDSAFAGVSQSACRTRERCCDIAVVATRKLLSPTSNPLDDRFETIALRRDGIPASDCSIPRLNRACGSKSGSFRVQLAPDKLERVDDPTRDQGHARSTPLSGAKPEPDPARIEKNRPRTLLRLLELTLTKPFNGFNVG